jgi:1,4-dihydroxy-2-naphthoyl-CoA hydrolase
MIMIDLTSMSPLMEMLDISIHEVTAIRVTGHVAAGNRHHQPMGIIHGGLHTAVIETVATAGAVEAVRDRGQLAVGVSNQTEILRPHRSGRLDVEAIAIQQGRTQQLWQVEIRRPADGKLVARGQVRLQNIDAAAVDQPGARIPRPH